MSREISIKPADGYVVRDPSSAAPLPATGAVVHHSAYWQRRINEGSVVITTAPAPAKRRKTQTDKE